MKKIQVTIAPSGEQFSAPEGQTLLEALRQQSLPLDAPCGGKGTCGKCRVLVNGRETLGQTVLLKTNLTNSMAATLT